MISENWVSLPELRQLVAAELIDEIPEPSGDRFANAEGFVVFYSSTGPG